LFILQLRIFINQPTTLDFDKADQMTATQVRRQLLIQRWKSQRIKIYRIGYRFSGDF
jgi:hypothetical protein